jgi:uncharacterized membrane protein YhaH (DUF805 family)
MKGRITDYSTESNSGVIMGDDGNRYQFNGTDWRAGGIPLVESVVQFATHGFQAKAIVTIASKQPSSGVFQYYLQGIQNYADFSGRARRSEYWYFALFNCLIGCGVVIADLWVGSYPLLYLIYILAVLIPTLAVGVRRLHDVNKSGWFYLIVIIPLIGAIWMFILMVSEGTDGSNQYGPDPKRGVVVM